MWKKDKQTISSGNDSANIQVGRDLNLYIGENTGCNSPADASNSTIEISLFEQYDFKWEPGYGDVSLLRPEQYGVEFHPEAKSTVDELVSWAKDKTASMALKVFVGPAGSGKTRLMLEVCHRLNENKWVSGFIRSNPPVDEDKELNKWWSDCSSNSFLVIDYAEARPSEVVSLLKSINRNKPHSLVRVILIARNIESWWYELMLKNSLVRAYSESDRFSGVTIIKELGNNDYRRCSIFTQAVYGYAKKLGCEIPSQVPDSPPKFIKETNGEPLYIHLSAISFLRSETPKSLFTTVHFLK